MARRKNKTAGNVLEKKGDGTQPDDQQKNNNDGGEGEDQGEKKESGDKSSSGSGGKITVILKVDYAHCDGCAAKIYKTIRRFPGVETVRFGKGGDGKVTVVGNLEDPGKLREKVEEKTRKKTELISPAAKKDNGKGGGGGEKTEEKNKQPPVTKAVLKLNLHCDGCIRKLIKIITRTKGYKEMEVDREKDRVTVTGSINMKVFAESLKKQLKKDIEIIPEKKKEGGGSKEKDENGEKKADWKKMLTEIDYPNFEPGQLLHAPQLFSDENPNACAVM